MFPVELTKRIPVSYKEREKLSCVLSKSLFLSQDQHDAPTWRKESSLGLGSSKSNPENGSNADIISERYRKSLQRTRETSLGWESCQYMVLCIPYTRRPPLLEEMPRGGEIQIPGCFHPRRWGERC